MRWSWPPSSRRAPVTRRSSSRRTPRSRPTRPAEWRPESRSCRSGATARTRPSSRWPCRRRRRPSTRSVFVSVANLDLERTSRRLELWGDGSLLEVRDVPLEAQARADVIVDDIDRDVRTRRGPPRRQRSGRRDGARPAGRRRPRVGRHPARPDAPDPRRRRGRSVPRDRAVVPAERRAVRRRAERVRPEDPAHRTAARGTSSSSRASSRRRCRAPRSSRSPRRARATSGRWPASSRTRGSARSTPDEPVLRFVDLSTTHIAEASQLTTPDWARTIIPGPRGAPLLYAGTRDGLPAAVLAFEPRRSDLPLQVAFPILLANLTGELLGSTDGADRGRRARHAGRARHPDRGHRPDRDGARRDASRELVPGTTGGVRGQLRRRPTCSASTRSRRSPTPTRRRRRRPVPAPGRRPVRGRARRPRASPGAAAGVGASASPPPRTRWPRSASRSTCSTSMNRRSPRAPRRRSRPSARRPPASPGPGASGAGEPRPQRPTTRDELWVPIVLLVLTFLCVEWALYHRDGARSGSVASLATRLRRDAGGTA